MSETSSNNEPRNTAFEELKRTQPDVKPLATVWRGSPEYFSWMEILLAQDENDTIQYVENEKVTTFYRTLTDLEVTNKEARAVENEKEPDDGNKSYTILSVPHEHGGEYESYHKVTFVKLGAPRWFPVGDRFAWVEYVLVDQYRQRIDVSEDEHFYHGITEILITDEDQTDYSDQGAKPIYSTPSYLEPWEVLWAIGEINTTTTTEIKE